MDTSPESFMLNLPYLEELYRQNALSPDWEAFFRDIESDEDVRVSASSSTPREEGTRRLIDAYRTHGHKIASVNPIALTPPSPIPELAAPSSEKKIAERLQQFYAGRIAFEFKGFTPPEMEQWIEEKIEGGWFQHPFSADEKNEILDTLTRAEVLEAFLHMKHVGKKRFSLEGGESLIPMLAFLVDRGIDKGAEEFVIGMSHRGRLNVLVNLLNKPLSYLFTDFDDDYEPSAEERMGDIRYHKGHVNEAVKSYLGKAIRLSVSPNPSHLESIDPVVEGQAYAKQTLAQDTAKKRIIPLLMHGDASLAGQGVVYETLQMQGLPGYETGGTIHIVINNQVGFTTSPKEGRSTLYCTDIAKTFGLPVIHVNAEDAEMCVRSALFALELRDLFHTDVFIDLNCYRKYGHNEGDEPAFTQPLEYQLIRGRRSIRTLYREKLIDEGAVDASFADELEARFRGELQAAFDLFSKQPKKSSAERSASLPHAEPPCTQVSKERLCEIAKAFSTPPKGFNIHPKLLALFQERSASVVGDKSLDWGTAELLAYGSLLWEGKQVRLAGQDSGRGTFSHRHALWVDQISGRPYFPLAHLTASQGQFVVLNTLLSETAALGFEYGYSTVCKEGLNIWEAQFGDFVNSAQVIIDQYIAGGEQKWGQVSNLVLFLPHGFEGQGPEHSSARFERFLALAGHENMQIVNPTVPSQLFHLLRAQVLRKEKKPLIVLTPKGLLRHPSCVSPLSDFTAGEFHPIFEEKQKAAKTELLVLCSGRIYFDIEAERKRLRREDVAIIRFEQLYPLDAAACKAALASYAAAKRVVWVQDEPENMGAWPHMSLVLSPLLPARMQLEYAGRERSATPATGFFARHRLEQKAILKEVFGA